MSQHRIAVVVGSLRRESFNKQLAAAIAKLGPSDFAFDTLRIDDLPLYNQDDDASPAPAVIRLKEAIRASAGVIFVTPEYNRSIPGVLKNALDHASRPYGQSAAVAQQHLRTMLAYLDMPTLGQPEVFLTAKDGFFGPSGEIADAGTRKFLQGWMDKYVAFVKEYAAKA
jgi:chromate reductase